MPLFRHVLEMDAVLEDGVLNCTQPTSTHAPAGLKRPRLDRRCKASAKRGASTAIPQTTSTLKKVTTFVGGLAKETPMMQTPMPASPVGNEFGPPPPDSTPARHRGKNYVFALCSVVWGLLFVLIWELLWSVSVTALGVLLHVAVACSISEFLTLPTLHSCAASSKCKTYKGGERESRALQASKAACMGAPCTTA